MAVDETVLQSLYAEGLTDKQVGERAGCSRDTVYRWRKANDLPANGGNEARRLRPGVEPKPFDVPELPDEKPTADELLARRIKQYQRKAKAKQARKLIPVNVRCDGPIAIAHFGDPHVDDDGTNLGLLQRHVDVVNRTEGMFAGNVGDFQNNWVGRLARLYAEQSTSAQEAWVLVEWLLTACDWLYLVGGNHDCHDTETEALTRRGWLRYDQIRDGDEVLSYVDGAARWSPIISRVEREHDGEMVTVENQSISLNVTPNHRILCKKRQRNQWPESFGYIPANDLVGRISLPVSGTAPSTDVALTDDQIALAGWILTDGSIYWKGNSPKITIYQSKNGAEIERLLSSLNLAHRHSIRDRTITEVCGRVLRAEPSPQHEWTLTADASRDVLEWVPEKGRLPDWAHDLSARQFGVLLDSIVAGDGCWDGINPSAKRVAVVHGSEPFLSSLQAVAVQHGWYARISVARGTDCRLNLCRRDDVQFDTRVAVKRTMYSGRVWCLTVPHGNFMIRRNGAAHFSGNCWSGTGDPLNWIARQQRALLEPHGARLELRLPSGRTVRVNARHDFKGHSMWNAAHGPAKAVQMGWRDHVLTCGHTHVSGYQILKDPSSGLISHAIRTASYKVFDRYAEEKGLPDQNIFMCPVTVIDPRYDDDDARFITFLPDPEEAAGYLTWKRARKAA